MNIPASTSSVSSLMYPATDTNNSLFYHDEFVDSNKVKEQLSRYLSSTHPITQEDNERYPLPATDPVIYSSRCSSSDNIYPLGHEKKTEHPINPIQHPNCRLFFLKNDLIDLELNKSLINSDKISQSAALCSSEGFIQTCYEYPHDTSEHKRYHHHYPINHYTHTNNDHYPTETRLSVKECETIMETLESPSVTHHIASPSSYLTNGHPLNLQDYDLSPTRKNESYHKDNLHKHKKIVSSMNIGCNSLSKSRNTLLEKETIKKMYPSITNGTKETIDTTFSSPHIEYHNCTDNNNNHLFNVSQTIPKTIKIEWEKIESQPPVESYNVVALHDLEKKKNSFQHPYYIPLRTETQTLKHYNSLSSPHYKQHNRVLCNNIPRIHRNLTDNDNSVSLIPSQQIIDSSLFDQETTPSDLSTLIHDGTLCPKESFDTLKSLPSQEISGPLSQMTSDTTYPMIIPPVISQSIETDHKLSDTPHIDWVYSTTVPPKKTREADLQNHTALTESPYVSSLFWEKDICLLDESHSFNHNASSRHTLGQLFHTDPLSSTTDMVHQDENLQTISPPLGSTVTTPIIYNGQTSLTQPLDFFHNESEQQHHLLNKYSTDTYLEERPIKQLNEFIHYIEYKDSLNDKKHQPLDTMDCYQEIDFINVSDHPTTYKPTIQTSQDNTSLFPYETTLSSCSSSFSGSSSITQAYDQLGQKKSQIGTNECSVDSTVPYENLNTSLISDTTNDLLEYHLYSHKTQNPDHSHYYSASNTSQTTLLPESHSNNSKHFYNDTDYPSPLLKTNKRKLIKPSRILCYQLKQIMPIVIRQIDTSSSSRKGLCRQLTGQLYLNSPKPSPNFLLNTLLPVYRAADILRFNWAYHLNSSLSYLRLWVCNQRGGKELIQQYRVEYNAPTGKDYRYTKLFAGSTDHHIEDYDKEEIYDWVI